MRWSILGSLGFMALTLSVTAPVRATEPSQSLLDQRDRVAAATVTLTQLSCAGVVAGAKDQVVTAAHCVPEEATEVRVKVSDGRVLGATVVHLDRDRDLALLRLPSNLPVEPLEISDALPAPGDKVLFVGRVDRASRPQVAHVARLGRCPSLPNLDEALFTSVRARPGDSGAPLVDDSLRIVGLIHGGARCHIATPTASLAKLALPDTAPPLAPAAPPLVPQSGKIGPFFWERIQDGFRVRFDFSFSWKSSD
jgi:S1-C subfamily serine protease